MAELHEADAQSAEQLREWAAEYAATSGGRLQVIEHDPEKYPFQEGVTYEGHPLDGAIVDSMAAIAQPLYPELFEQLKYDEAATQRLSMVGELLAGGNNVVLTTNHGDLIDIAIAHAAVYSQLEHGGYRPQTGIIISKMITYLAYRLGDEFAPCPDVLQMLENTTFFSFPKTESSKKHLKDRILPSEIDKHNRRMRKAVHEKLGEGSLLLAMAASGTTDKPSPEDPSIITMGTVGVGTSRIMAADNTYVAPLAVFYQGEHRIMQFADIPRRVTTEEQAHNVMQAIATTLNEQTEDDLTFQYA